MKEIWSQGYGMFKGAVKWAHCEVRESASNFMRDFRSLRALWNWLFLALYTWVVIWGMLYHADACANTIIVTTGGIVSWIFSNYVVSSHMDKRLSKFVPGMGQGSPSAPEDPGNG